MNYKTPTTRYYFSYCLLFLLSINAFAQKDTIWLDGNLFFYDFVSQNEKYAQKYSLKDNSKSDSNIAKVFYATHQLFRESIYNEKENSLSTKVYNKDGSVILKEAYKDGIYKRYYPNGNLAASLYLGGSFDFFNQNVKTKEKFIYEPRDKEKTKYELYYSNGTKALEIDLSKELYVCFFPNGVKASELIKNETGYLYKRYSWNGNRYEEAQLNFLFKANGIYKRYDFNGNLREKGNYYYPPIHNDYPTGSSVLDGPTSYKVGTWETYYINGKLHKKEELSLEDDYDFTNEYSSIEVEETVIDSNGNISETEDTSTEDKPKKIEKRKAPTVEIYDIDGKRINTFKKSDRDTIFEIYVAEVNKYILKLIREKEPTIISNSEFEATVKEVDGKLYKGDALFTGKVLYGDRIERGEYSFSSEGFNLGEYKDGNIHTTTDIYIEDEGGFGLVAEIRFVQQGRDRELRSYVDNSLFHERKNGENTDYYVRAFRKTSRPFGNRRINKLKVDIVPDILNYILDREAEESYRFNDMFIPSYEQDTSKKDKLFGSYDANSRKLQEYLRFESRF